MTENDAVLAAAINRAGGSKLDATIWGPHVFQWNLGRRPHPLLRLRETTVLAGEANLWLAAEHPGRTWTVIKRTPR
jgi:hypothetical protein